MKIAHRGFVDSCKENTVTSFLNAKKKGFDMIEMDIQLTKDNEIIIYHDLLLNGAFIETLELKKIKELNKIIPTLWECFQEINYKEIYIYLDLKGKDELASVLFTFFIKHSINTSKIFIASFNCNHLDFLSKYPLKLGFISSNKLDITMLHHIIQKYCVSFFAFCWTVLDDDIIHFLHLQNKKIFVYSIQTPSVYQKFLKKDIDGFISDIELINE